MDSFDRFRKKYHRKIEKYNDSWPYDVHEVFNCINRHLFEQQSTMDWWKHECHIDDHNFSSKFAHYIGKSPKQYILHHRIGFAKVLLGAYEKPLSFWVGQKLGNFFRL